MRLLIQPGEGILPLLKGINRAKECVDIVIFRFDQKEIESALAKAVSRGVRVRALIANTNRAGELNLRRLEMRLLSAGVTVARTADDLLRYHGKLMVIDRRELYLLAFNLTHADVEYSRSFGIITRSRDLVREAESLIEADIMRHPYEPELDRFVVSPVSARRRLADFIRGAKRELVIYDPKISDLPMIRLLEERARAGVDIRIIGRMSINVDGLPARKLSQMRLHTRTMVRDGLFVFVGSQSLRAVELDARREVGAIFRSAEIATRLLRTFEEDWSKADRQEQQDAAEEKGPDSVRIARRVAKAVAKEIPPVAPLLDGVVRKVVGDEGKVELNEQEVEEMVKGAVKEAVREVVRGVMEEVVESRGRVN
jgi:cardiolipin synthase A/B